MSEAVVPEIGDGGEVGQGDRLDLKHGWSLVCRVSLWFLELIHIRGCGELKLKAYLTNDG